jgi:hypothetical protein
MADRVISLAPSWAAHRIVLLDPSDGEPFGLNLLACRKPIRGLRDDPTTWAADSVVETIKKLYGEADEYLPRLERYLNLAARTLIPSGLTLAQAPRLFDDEAFRERCLRRVPSNKGWQDKLRRRWKRYSQLRPAEQDSHIEAVVNRLERLLDADLIDAIVGSRTTTVPFDDVLDGDTMLIVRLPHEILGEERCDFIGAMLLCAIADRIFVRSLKTDPPRVHLYLDEYQRFATTTTRQLLTQGRKFGAGVTLAFQDLSPIKDQAVRDACRHVGNLIVLGVTWPDAELLAGEFPIKPTEERTEYLTVPDGTKPIKAVTQDPIGHLLRQTHDDEVVRFTARRTLRSLQERIDRLREMPPPRPVSVDRRHSFYEFPGKIDLSPHPRDYLPNLQDAYNLIHELLLDVMEPNSQVTVGSLDFVVRVMPIIDKLAVPMLGIEPTDMFKRSMTTEQSEVVADWVKGYAKKLFDIPDWSHGQKFA